jgi:hypothetical protein
MSTHNERKPRDVEIRVDFGKKQIISGMHETPDGKLTFFDENGKEIAPIHIEVGAVYPRGHGKTPKTLTRSLTIPSAILLEANRNLTRFERVFAIDTNTRDIEGTSVSVSVLVEVTGIQIGSVQWNAQLRTIRGFEFHNPSKTPEKIGWANAVSHIQKILVGYQRVALIVDHDLGRLTMFNRRLERFFPDFELPSNFELIYGCGDRGTLEYIANAAVAECDRKATLVVTQIAKLGTSSAIVPKRKAPFTACRYWEFGAGPS